MTAWKKHKIESHIIEKCNARTHGRLQKVNTLHKFATAIREKPVSDRDSGPYLFEINEMIFLNLKKCKFEGLCIVANESVIIMYNSIKTIKAY